MFSFKELSQQCRSFVLSVAAIGVLVSPMSAVAQRASRRPVPQNASRQPAQSLEEQILSGDFQDTSAGDTGSSALPVINENTSIDDDVVVDAPPAAAAPSTTSSADELLQDNLPEVDEDDLEAVDEAVIGPKNVPKSHILVVQHQTINKAGRHEIMPFSLGLQPADSFRRQFQWGFGYTYHLNEAIAIEAVHAGFMFNYSGKLARTIRENTGLETNREEPAMVLGSSLLWTPLRSKAAMAEDVYYFEGYFILGGGMTRFETEFVPMAMGGVGFRMYVTERTLVKLEVRDYIDFKDGSDQRMNVLLGAAILWGDGK